MGWFDDNSPSQLMDVAKGRGMALQEQAAMRRAPAVNTRGTTLDRNQTGGTTGGSPSMPLEQAIQQYQATHPYSPQSYLGLFDYLKGLGYQVERPTRAGGTMQSDDKLVGPDGKMYDLITGVDGGNPSWSTPSHIPGEYWFNGQRVQRPEELGPGGMTQGGGGTLGGMGGGGMIPGGMPAGWSTQGANRLASFSAPGLAAPWTEEFRARDPNQIANDPSYKFQFGQGMDAIQRSAASKGTLLTGGTLKALNEFGQGIASTYDDKFYNRDRAEYGMAQDTFNTNKDSAYRMLSGMTGSGQQAAGQYGANVADLYGNNALANASLYGNQGNINATGTLTGAQNNAGMWNTIGGLVNAGATMYNNRQRTPTTTPAPFTATTDPNALARLGQPIAMARG